MAPEEKKLSSLKQKTIASLIWKLFERAGNQVIQLIVQIVMARMLAPGYFGALAIMLVFVNMGSVLVASGLGTALIQTSDLKSKDCSSVFWTSFCIAVFLYAAVFFSAPAIAAFYSMEELVWPLRVLTLIFVIGSYNVVQVAIIARNLEFKKIFFATIFSVIVSGSTGVVLAMLGGGLWALVAQQITHSVVNCIAMAAQVRWRPRFEFDGARVRELFSFSWKLLVSGILDTGYQSLSDLIVGKQFSAFDLGLVSQGKRYPNALGSILDGAIQPVMLSAVSRVKDDCGQVKRLVRRALKTSTFVVFPTMTLFALVAEPLVGFLLGERWLDCVPFLQMYCFICALLPIHTSNLQAFNGLGRSDLFLKLEVIKKSYGVVILLIAALVFRDIYAIIGGYMLTGVISTFVNAFPNRRLIGYSYKEQIQDVAPALAISLVSGAAAYAVAFVGLPAIMTAFSQCAVMFGLYFSLSFIFRVESLEYLLGVIKELPKRRV